MTREALQLQSFETHMVRVDTASGQYTGLLDNYDGRLCWLADPECPPAQPPLACIALGATWAVQHIATGCPACEAEAQREGDA